MKNLTLIMTLDGIAPVHLGKDVFNLPYYLSKSLNYEFKMILTESNFNISIPNKYKGIDIIKLKKEHKHLHFAKYILENGKKIDILMLFHICEESFFIAEFYKKINPDGKVFLKGDVSANSITKKRNQFRTFLALFYYKTIFRKFYYKNKFKSINIISVETQEALDYFSKSKFFGVRLNNKTILLPNGFDESLINENHVLIKEFEEKSNTIISVGRIGTYEKNNELLLSALENLDIKNWMVKFIGPYTSDFERRFNKFIEKNPEKKGFVILVGGVEKRKLLEEYNDSKIFVLTSRWEGFALVLPEAIRFGNYVISTNLSCAKDITDNFSLGDCFENENVSQLIICLKKVIDGKVNLKEKYEKTIIFGKNNFIWDNIVKNNIDKIKGILEIE